MTSLPLITYTIYNNTRIGNILIYVVYHYPRAKHASALPLVDYVYPAQASQSTNTNVPGPKNLGLYENYPCLLN